LHLEFLLHKNRHLTLLVITSQFIYRSAAVALPFARSDRFNIDAVS